METEGPAIPVRMNKRITEKSLKNMNGDFLLGLRDMRRSENGHYVRSHNQAAGDTERKTINMWFKEQRWQLAKVKRGQLQFYNRLVKVHRHKRKCQREEYKRRQEEIRRDMQNIRIRRLCKRVVEKFRQNVKRKKAERARKRFAIAGGLRNASGLGGSAQHGVAGIKPQTTDGITRMIKLAAKRDSLQKTGELPSEASDDKLQAETTKSFKVLKTESEFVSKESGVFGAKDNENKTVLNGPETPTDAKTVPKSPPKTTELGSNERLVKAHSVQDITGEKKTQEQRNDIPVPVHVSNAVSRLTAENVAVHNQLQSEANLGENGTNFYKRTPDAVKVIEPTKNKGAVTKTLFVGDNGTMTSMDSDRTPLSASQFPGEEDTPQRKELGQLRIPRRATLKPPPTSFLLKIDEVEAVQKANPADQEGGRVDSIPEGEQETTREDKDEQPSVLLSRKIRWERKFAEQRRLDELNQELIPHYKRTRDGGLRVQMVPFVRTSFLPPSNKIRYEQDKMKKEEKINMARQKVRVRNFVHHCPVAGPDASQVTFTQKKDTLPKNSIEQRSDKPLSLTALMFSVYHQEMPPEGVDPNSTEALKKCRYIRLYDVAKSRKEQEKVLNRKQRSSWGTSGMSEQEKRRQLMLQRQRALYR